MWKLSVLSLAVALSGCVMTGRAPNLATYDTASYEKDQYGQEYMTGLSFKYPAPARLKPDALPLCIVKTIDNRSVTLSDSSRSWVGPYSGYYYRMGVQREAGGGEVLSFVSEDKREAVATGTVTHRYTFGMAPIERSVRFTLNAKVGASETMFRFDRLEWAQLDTGVAANNGYDRIGAWEKARPELAAESLKLVADKLSSCLSQ